MSINFFIPYPIGIAPSQRFRFEFYLTDLSNRHTIELFPFYTHQEYAKIQTKSSFLIKVIIVFKAFLRRFGHCFKARTSDIIYIHREASPLGPPFFEFILCKIFHKKIIYDFDDAIWLNDPHESTLMGFIKWKSKVGSICRWSTIVTCGNKYLADYARQFCTDVRILPTVINPDVHRRTGINETKSIPTIGWTGSQSTLIYLNDIIPVLRTLQKQVPFQVVIIANVNPGFPDDFISFVPWDLEREISDLERIEIGIMPLPDDQWSKGKCGFKLIQYGAMSIPSVASSVGVNPEVVQHGVTGFLCENNEQWEQHLLTLLRNKSLRDEMGTKARARIINEYSTDSQRDHFIRLFDNTP